MKLTELCAGTHLVKVIYCDTELQDESENHDYIIKLENNYGYFKWRIKADNESQLFLQAVDIDPTYADHKEILPIAFQSAINKYVIIIISETNNVFSVSDCQHPDEIYKFYIAFIPPRLDIYMEENFIFKILLAASRNSQHEFNIDPIIKRKYFISFEDAEMFLMAEYNEIQKISDSRLEKRVLFKTDRDLLNNERVLIKIDDNVIHYYNELSHRNNEINKYQVEVYTPDQFDDNTDYIKCFKTQEAAYNFISSFDGENGSACNMSYARLIHDGEKYTQEYLKSSDRNTTAMEKFDEKYVDNMLGNLNKKDQDLLDSAFEGDPENSWNID